MITRRTFFGSFAAVPALLATPSLALASVKDNFEALSLPITPLIAALEAKVRANPDAFNWATHNELRHQYLSISEAKSRMHSDIILSHNIMDSYILHTLSDWHLDNRHGNADFLLGITILLNNADRYGYLFHL